ncbi:MAG: VCBS repeat-containing protein, partial [Planctomycetota bacterium]
IGDLDGDGFPEVVTACEQTPGAGKAITHPRIYKNLGRGPDGWLGLRYEEARFPQLLHLTTGVPLEPRFPTVELADLNGDGFADLYFGDHDTGTTLFGGLQPASEDTDDRVLFNDGNGFFTDVSSTAMTPAMLASNFCNSVVLADVNADGAIDVVKQTTYAAPEIVSIAYNDPLAPGSFTVQETYSPPSPYFVDAGDLNADGRLDIVLTQNDDDGMVFNLGNGPDGRVDWSPGVAPYELLVGAEPVGQFGLSYSSNTRVLDLDQDGWSEVLVADVDPEINFYEDGFRLHLYHNRGGTPGGTDVVLREERGSALDGQTAANGSWIGARGLSALDLRWTHDFAVFDVDGDGLLDLVLSRREGTQVWLQRPAPTCQPDLGFGDGAPMLELCGDALASGGTATLKLYAGAPLAPALFAFATAANPTPIPSLGITVVPSPTVAQVPSNTDALGTAALGVNGGNGPLTVVVQAFTLELGSLSVEGSNAVAAEFLP